MSLNTLLALRKSKNIKGHADRIVGAYDQATNLWSKIIDSSIDIDDLAKRIDEAEEEFSSKCLVDTGIWQEAMAWTAMLYFYDAQDGLYGESGFGAGKVRSAIHKSNCSDLVKRNVDYAWCILRKKKIEC